MLVVAGGAAALGFPRAAGARVAADHSRDWAWLEGNWKVWHRRLRTRLARSNEWDEFAGKSALWLTMGGLGTIDDNVLELPDGTYRALGIRAFDPASDKWSIWWLDGRNPTRIDPPVMGGFEGDSGLFTGRDTFNDRPITVRFRWHEIHGPRPHWDQAFSTDGGKRWEVNWQNAFTRTHATPTPFEASSSDFDFLVGRWIVRHRRLKERLVGSADWEEFGGTFVNWPVLGGRGNVGDNMFERSAGVHRGVGFRSFDASTGRWSSWWLDGRNPGAIAAPLVGGFKGGVGSFLGKDMHSGRPVKIRALWSHITPSSARWEQALSANGGASWETNWISEFTRTA